jgi:ERCC4-related helicase
MRVLCRDAEWLVTRVEPSNRSNSEFAVHCTGADDLVRGQPAIFLTQLDEIQPVDPRQTVLVEDTSGGYKQAKLFLEAQLRQMPVTGTDPDLEGMGAFKPMRYQREAVHRALLQMRPRLLLADAVGLGKTIEVGMILVELLRRGRANRILVLAKKSMLAQFQAELWNRFSIPLVRLDSQGIAKLRLRIPASKNPFEVYHRIIMSIDTLKDVGRYRHFLEETRWDVVIIDEAHNVAGASVPERHLSHRLARQLSRRTDSLILTTATPHNGKRATFGRLISLLDPSAIPDPKFEEYEAEDIRQFFLMRFKEDVREEAGDNFPERVVVPRAETTCNAGPEEEAVYASLAELRQLCAATKNKEALVQWGLYKLFLSSPEACLSTVRHRLRKMSPGSDEVPHLRRLEQALVALPITRSSRYCLLKAQLTKMGWDGSPNSPRVLVFTESRETQDALVDALAGDFRIPFSKEPKDQKAQMLAYIHGGFADTDLMHTVEAFGTGSSPLRMMVATDVASEGVNLHHECHNIIHYDLPWSIITLIQRNGRIDRFGQKSQPVLRYLMVRTQAGLLRGDEAIFERLIEKVEEINRTARSGESVLQLYDPEAEQEYVANEGILKGDGEVLEKPAKNAAGNEAAKLEFELLEANKEGHESFLQFLLGMDTMPAAAAPASTLAPITRLRLFSDRRFLLEGYRFLAEKSPEYQPIQTTDKLIILNAPADLRRRLGAPDAGGDVVFGATAIPFEAWPENDQFRLTDNVEQVNTAIQAAHHTSGQWSRELLCAEQHPILTWLTERLVMLLRRNEAPLVRSRHLQRGEICFCFVGQVSSKAGTPLVADAHAVSFFPGGKLLARPLREALDAAHFDDLVNDGAGTRSQQGQILLPSAVKASLDHMRMVVRLREQRVAPLLKEEEDRLGEWSRKREKLLLDRMAGLADTHPMYRRHRHDLEELKKYLDDRRRNWRDTHFTPAEDPSTRLVLVIEGVA